MDKICPFMSDFTEGENYVDCAKEKCALWVAKKADIPSSELYSDYLIQEDDGICAITLKGMER